ncbi:hypothetical protein [uncultured Enterococcus sp.]|nr:hypothetical protein [uncultured Enterococcus sp.]
MKRIEWGVNGLLMIADGIEKNDTQKKNWTPAATEQNEYQINNQ